MKIKIITNPDAKIRQKVLIFQFQFMGWDRNEMEEQEDRYGTIPFGYVIGYEGKKIIGAINLTKRKIKFKDNNVLLGGIGGVCTHSKFLRKGTATKLLKVAAKELKKADCDIAFLCTDIKKLGSLYSQVGFVSLERGYKATGESGKIYKDKGGMIAPINSKELFEKVKEDKKEFDMQGQDW